MQISEARLENGWLSLKTQPTEAYKFVKTFKPADYDIKKSVKSRSKNANALAWALMNEISREVGIPAIEIYREQVKNIGGYATTVTISRNALKSFERAFCREHIARSIEVIGEDEDFNTVDILVTYGSSDYDTKQMSQLIDNIIQDCKQLGIETPEDDYINQLIADWEAHHDK